MQGRGIYPDGLASRFMGDIFEVKGDISEIRAGFLFYGRNPGFKGELEIFRQGPGGVSRDIPQQVFNLFMSEISGFMREIPGICAKNSFYARNMKYMRELSIIRQIPTPPTSRIPAQQTPNSYCYHCNPL